MQVVRITPIWPPFVKGSSSPPPKEFVSFGFFSGRLCFIVVSAASAFPFKLARCSAGLYQTPIGGLGRSA